MSEHAANEDTTELVLVVLLEFTPRDRGGPSLLREHLSRRGVTATDLGRRLLTLAALDETEDD